MTKGKSGPAPPCLKPPKYHAVRDWLAERIADGTYGPGAQLPSEHELLSRFSVSRMTVRQAFDDLRHRGMIEARRGKGHFTSRVVCVQNLERLQSFGEMMAPLGIATSSKVIELLEVPATREIAAALKIAPETPVTRIARQRMAGGAALSLDISFFPLDIGRRLMTLDLANQDIFLLLERRLGVELGFADLTIDVAPADPRHAPFVGVAPDEPVLRIRRLTIDDNGRPIDYERIYARLDSMKFRLRAPRW